MSAPCPRGAAAAPVLEFEAWDAPDRLTGDDCITETCPDRRWTRGGDLDPETDQ